MESKYENLKYIPLSSNDMLKLNKNTRLITYKDLFYCNDIDKCFGQYDKIILFFPMSDACNGHWTGLLRKNKSIYFFDSYAFIPDEEIDFSKSNKKIHDNIKIPRLTQLLYDAEQKGYTIYRNPYRLQSPKTNTCGRYVTLFLNEELTPTQLYQKYFEKNGRKPDDIIVKLIDY